MKVETAKDRYTDLLASVPSLNSELRPEALKDVIERAGADVTPALTEHIAANSQLTTAQAEPLVKQALAAVPEGSSTEKAAAVSQAAASALPGVNLELSEAVMLGANVRFAFAIVFSAILAVCVGATIAIGTESSPSEAVLITLSAVAILILAGVLVLVMGYKTAKIKLGS